MKGIQIVVMQYPVEQTPKQKNRFSDSEICSEIFITYQSLSFTFIKGRWILLFKGKATGFDIDCFSQSYTIKSASLTIKYLTELTKVVIERVSLLFFFFWIRCNRGNCNIDNRHTNVDILRLSKGTVIPNNKVILPTRSCHHSNCK